MNEREKLRERIQRQMKQDSAEEISDRSIYITDLVMSTLDSWIEEQQPEKFEADERVALKWRLTRSGGSGTARECDVSEEMERIEKGALGTVITQGSNSDNHHVLVQFDDITDDWWFHPDDLEKV